MGVVIPRVVTEVSASGAQVIDGSLKFDSSSSQYLTRTPGSAGNRTVFTWSGWVKRVSEPDQHIWRATSDGSNYSEIYFNTDGTLNTQNVVSGSANSRLVTTQLFRDFSSWYHIVLSSNGSTSLKFYVNGTEITNLSTNTVGSSDWQLNNTVSHTLGSSAGSSYASICLSNVYLIDGLTLGPGYFGYTDPLTNTWRPRKKVKQGAPTVNNGTTWSDYITAGSTTRSGFPASNLFNGTLTDSGAMATTDSVDGTYIEFDFSSMGGIPFQTIEYSYEKNGQNNMILTFNHVSQDYTTNYSYNSFNWRTVTGIEPGRLFNIKVDKNGDSGASYFAGLKIDGVVMLDSTTTNLDYGTNGFYLPMDGNTPIGKDQSGKGNDWTPVNFGGSNIIPKATGALPILNTVNGGTSATVGVRTDSNYSDLVLALPLVGNADDVSNQINSGSTTKTITANGNAAASSVAANFYGGSYYFDGSGDYLSVPDNADFNFGTGDSTIEMWVYPTLISGTAENLITRGTSGYSGFIMSVTNFLDSTDGGSSWNVNITFDNPLVVNVWQHVAVCRSGSTWTVYINGVENGSSTVDANAVVSSAQTLTIGQRTGQTDFKGYLSDIHIYKGVAKYTENFIPASTNPDILPDTPSGVAYGSQLTKVTDGAVGFDGSGDYLNTTTSSADFTFGTGDFTVECWAYTNVQSGEDGIFQISTNSGGLNVA